MVPIAPCSSHQTHAFTRIMLLPIQEPGVMHSHSGLLSWWELSLRLLFQCIVVAACCRIETTGCGCSLWDEEERIRNWKNLEYLQAGVQLIGTSTFCVGQTSSRRKEHSLYVGKSSPQYHAMLLEFVRRGRRSRRLFGVCKETIWCLQ